MQTRVAAVAAAVVISAGCIAVLSPSRATAVVSFAASDGHHEDKVFGSETTAKFLTDEARSLASSLASDRGMEDLVTSLPGANFENSFALFSGYLEVSETKRSMYHFVTARNASEAASKPVVMWTNGGPGCSGLIGFYTEMGPFRPTEDMTLEPFDYAWNKDANMLFIESPAGVGFSYGTGADYDAGDASTAEDNFALLMAFFARFPGLASNDLYLSAESYGGHYIPTLARLMVGARDKGSHGSEGYQVASRLKGALVGNPYTDPVENTHGMFGAYFGRSMVPAPMYHEWFNKCGIHTELEYYQPNLSNPSKASMDCFDLESAMWESVGDIDPYGVDFPVCNRQQGASGDDATFKTGSSRQGAVLRKAAAEAGRSSFFEGATDKHSATRRRALLSSGKLSNSAPAAFGYDACVGDYVTQYLNKEEVKVALHANVTMEWAECSLPGGLSYNYADMNNFMEPLWKELVNANLQIMIFSGDDDSICGPLGTQNWLYALADEMGLNTTDAWAPWYYVDPVYGDGQLGGYKVRFEDSNLTTGITYVTVHHAGHEVPMYQPMKGSHVFHNYINGLW